MKEREGLGISPKAHASPSMINDLLMACFFLIYIQFEEDVLPRGT